MFGIDMMMKEMLGIEPAELKEQIANATNNAQQLVNQIVNNQNITLEALKLIHHKQIRIEKMLESIMRERGIELPSEDDNGHARITN